MTTPTPQSWQKIERILDRHYLDGIHSLKNHGVAKEISDWVELEYVSARKQGRNWKWNEHRNKWEFKVQKNI